MFCIAPRSWQPESTSRWRIILDRAKRKQCRLRGVGSPNEHQPHAKHTEGSRRPSVQGKVKANRTAVQGACVRGFRVCRNAWRSWGSSRRRAKRELSARRQIQGKPGALETYQSDEVTCPLHGCYRGVKRTYLGHRSKTAFDPTRTLEAAGTHDRHAGYVARLYEASWVCEPRIRE